MDLRHSILIYHLPEAYLEDAVKSISEMTTISEKSISLMKPDHWGAKLILDNEQNFRKVISLCVLYIHNKTYSLYSLVTDLIVCGTGAQIDALKVEFLLERYAPVLVVYEVKNQQGAITFRAALNYPEIPEIIQLWTDPKLKISGYDGIEFSISSFCRFCRENGHFKSQCRKIKIPVAREVTSGFPSLPNCRGRLTADKQTTAVASSGSSTGFANLTKGSSDNSAGFTNFVKGSSDNNAGFADFGRRNFASSAVFRNDSDSTKKAAFEATSSKPLSPSTNLKHLIPPTMQNDIETLKLFFSHCKSFKHLYKSALRYPAGIGALLRQLRKILKFNKNIKTKSEEEMKFIAWICLLLSKLQYFHLKKNIQLERFYVPPL